MPETITLKDVYDELHQIKEKMVSKEELAQLLETMEILHNPDTMQQVRGSDEDIHNGRTRPLHGVKDILAEL